MAIFVPGIGGSNLYSVQYNKFKTYLTVNFMLGRNDKKYDDEVKNIQSKYEVDVIQDSDIHLFGKDFVPGYTRTRMFFYNHGWSIRIPASEWLPGNQDSKDRIYYEFPYDWRLDIRKHAVDLNKFVSGRVLKEFPNAELYLIAHSTGGIISRAYLSNLYLEEYDVDGTLLRRLQPHPNIKKQILIGTPNHGAPKAYRVLKSGQGFLENRGLKQFLPNNLKDLCINWPLVYQLLPATQYERNFSPPVAYGPVASISSVGMPTVKETYIASQNTKFSDPQVIARYSLNNDAMVNNALQLHDDLGRETFLPIGDTYVIYSNSLETVAGIRWNVTSDNHNVVFKNIGDGTVPARSVHDLKGLSDDAGTVLEEYDARYNDGNDFDPDTYHAINMKNIGHTALPSDIYVLEIVFSIIEAA